MDKKEILDFKESLVNMSIDELTDMRDSLQQKIAQMILESDTVLKVAIVENLLTEKLDEETK